MEVQEMANRPVAWSQTRETENPCTTFSLLVSEISQMLKNHWLGRHIKVSCTMNPNEGDMGAPIFHEDGTKVFWYAEWINPEDLIQPADCFFSTKCKPNDFNLTFCFQDFPHYFGVEQ